MPISPSHLPRELHCIIPIIPLAERHGSNARISNSDRRLRRHAKYGETLTWACSTHRWQKINSVLRSFGVVDFEWRFHMKSIATVMAALTIAFAQPALSAAVPKDLTVVPNEPVDESIMNAYAKLGGKFGVVVVMEPGGVASYQPFGV
jgi:hypothetical protein